MKPVYFILATLLCLLLFITHGNSQQEDGDQTQTEDENTGNAGDAKPEPTPKITSPSGIQTNNTSGTGTMLGGLADPDTMKRMLYVLLAFTTLVIAFFAFKTIRCTHCSSISSF